MAQCPHLEGQVFSNLTVLYRCGHTPSGKVTWRCRCLCGEETTVSTGDLRFGNVKSCGCLRSTRAGLSCLDYAYDRWRDMHSRCEDASNKSYARYGGRGIVVCSRWSDLALFVEDMGEPPFVGATIERVDNDGNYEPSNCRWASRYEQARNRRSSRLLSYGGVTKNLVDWAKELGMAKSTLHGKLRRGVTLEQIINEKI